MLRTGKGSVGVWHKSRPVWLQGVESGQKNEGDPSLQGGPWLEKERALPLNTRERYGTALCLCVYNCKGIIY